MMGFFLYIYIKKVCFFKCFFFFGIVGENVFVDINWYEQEKSWVLEGHSKVGAYKFCQTAKNMVRNALYKK